MTIVRDGDDPTTIANRLGLVHGPIDIDAVVVDVFESMGVEPDVLRGALVAGRSKFARPKDPIHVPGGSGVELYGRLEGQSFVLDRMVVGQVTYFGANEGGMSHVTDYSRIQEGTPALTEVGHLIGLDLSDALEMDSFQSARSPVVRGAMGADRGAMHYEVERIATSI